MRYNNFIELPIFSDEYVTGSNKSLPVIFINQQGDWRNHLPMPEDQYKNGFESQSCVTFNTLDAGVETLMRYQHGIQNPDYSERFTSTLSGTTETGNNPQRVGEAIRKYGLIPEAMLPFNETIDTWNEFFDTEHVESLKEEGKKWLKEWDFRHEWLWKDKNFDISRKTELISTMLKTSPVGVSVLGWLEDGEGSYFKPAHLNDNHFTMIVAEDDTYFYVRDTYPPYEKKIKKGYDFKYAKRYMLDKRKGTNIFFPFSPFASLKIPNWNPVPKFSACLP